MLAARESALNIRTALIAALCCVAGPVLACYTVYDRDNRVLYNAEVPPVDMSRPLSETVPAAFPSGHLVFGAGGSCPSANEPAPRMRMASTNGKSPLLTDPGTARSLGLPHTMLANGVAVVQERPDNMRPGLVLADSGLPQGGTTAMGAGPARNPTSAMGAGPARGPVITEMHNPPITAVQPAPMNRSR